jgi:CheY-like chemotaxis protein
MSMIYSVLIVDDDDDALRLQKKMLERKMDASITVTKHPSQALKWARENFYDFCLLDITMPFNGNPFGGIDLHNLLRARYGAHSLLAYSHYITDDLLKMYQCSFNFLEKSADLNKFIRDINEKMLNLRQQQTCFVAMPFEDSYDVLYESIKQAIEVAHYVPVRLDRLPFTKSIVEKMNQEINNSKVVVFVSTGKNPNAFYECGYSVALAKEVITITDYYKNLPFDIRDRNAIAYGSDVSSVVSILADRLRRLPQT